MRWRTEPLRRAKRATTIIFCCRGLEEVSEFEYKEKYPNCEG